MSTINTQNKIRYASVGVRNYQVYELIGGYPNHETMRQVSKQLFEKIMTTEGIREFKKEEYLIYVQRKGLYCVLCVMDNGSSRRIGLNFLQDLFRELEEELLGSKQIIRMVKMKMKKHNESDAIEKIQYRLGEVKEIMVDNIDKILESTEKLDVLEEKSGALEIVGSKMQTKSLALKRRARLRMCIGILVALFFCFLCILVVLAAMGIVLCKFVPSLQGCGFFPARG